MFFDGVVFPALDAVYDDARKFPLHPVVDGWTTYKTAYIEIMGQIVSLLCV